MAKSQRRRAGPICPWCGEGDIPEADRPRCDPPAHPACLLRQVIGSVAHQQRRCHCYGGTDTDDPGLTRRQAAEDAVAYWRLSARFPEAPSP